MQLSAEVRRGWAKNPSNVKVEDFRIKFLSSNNSTPTKRKATALERQQATINAKMKWGAVMGKPIKSTPPISPTSGG